jgi:putative transposase
VTQDNVAKLIQPEAFSDPLTEVLREGARALLAQAVEAEVAAFLSGHANRQTEDGRQRLVRHGHRPERAIMTGLGPVAVRAPRIRDRTGAGESRIRFTSAILPPYARRSKSLEVLIPILYLKGISSGDFEDALSALLGPDAGGLSASSIARLKDAWSDEHARWSKRDLSAKRYVYFWVDGIHVQARLEDAAQCFVVIIGATPEGKKEVVGLIDGVRESAQSWRAMGPELAVADGALGFWQAIEEVWPQTRGQRCWVHKTANVLNKLPKSQQPKAKRAVQEIWMAETKRTRAPYPIRGQVLALDCRPIRPPGIADDGRRHSAAVRDCLSSSDTAHIVSTTGDLMNCRLGLESTCRPSVSSPPR